ncbi:MAG: hypothetical protein ACQESD_01125 [Thermoplasmatota archaeon]
MKNETNSIQDKVDLVTVSKFRDKTKVEEAIKIQDELRKKSKDWNGVEEIRRWREAR